jgi:hypothetical protein
VILEPKGPRERRKLAIDLDDLDLAFDNASWETSYYLDLETGQVIMVTDEISRELEAIDEELDREGDKQPAGYAGELERRDLPQWMREAVEQAAEVEAGYSTRYIAVPRAESRDGYQDMEDFIPTVRDQRLQDRLWRAIRGRGAFRRFKDVLADHPPEQEIWFAFRDARLRQRVLDWLAEEDIEPTAE